ncbi:glutamine synthetase family protein [Crossiella sp. SN42]|uniref:glutamine synthetase family protein n=1 Tax=Crossiella sp. SN42 TaxID=2944808 RepID=UPI00207C8E4E|nr:glutamine synthetase family protein [Crossiella sp. SN42]MCO1575072.1 glutamine synthetase family protein [Crossiella sp. SN42]
MVPDGGIDLVRVLFPDLLGIPRGKEVPARLLPELAERGLSFCRGVYYTSARGENIPAPAALGAGLPDVVARPLLDTVTPLPWAPGTAWCLAEVTEPGGPPAVEDPRAALRRVLARFAAEGLSPVLGPELEFFLLEPVDGGFRRYGPGLGNIYTTGLKGDPRGLLPHFLRGLTGMGLDVLGGNHEFGSGQFEINLGHAPALAAADACFGFKFGVRELAAGHGLHATFMGKPFNDDGGSGFHLHLSIADGEGRNLFDDPGGEHGLSALARHAVAGILAHAPALTALLAPTVNAYRRLQPDTLAPFLIDWGLDNRCALVRVPPERGDGARLEVRLGDAAANPYLGAAAVLAAAYLGIEGGLEPGEPLSGYGYDPARSGVLPGDLGSALDALAADAALTEVLGAGLVEAFTAVKRFEVAEFARYVTDWEFREYAHHL